MKKISFLINLCTISLLIFSCNKKFNYDTAYRFNVNQGVISKPKEKATPLEKSQEVLIPEEIAGSTEQKPSIVKSTNIAEVRSSPKVKSETGTTQLKPVETNRSKKELIKEIKKEIKAIKKINKSQQIKDSFFLKGIGLILLGLVLIVLGIVFLNALGVLLGSLVAGIGVILFLIGFLGLIL